MKKTNAEESHYMTRTPQHIAADLRAVAEMLNVAAAEIEQVTAVDPKMLEAFKTLAPLFAGTTIQPAAVEPPPPALGGGTVEPSPLRRPLPTPHYTQRPPMIPSRGPAKNP